MDLTKEQIERANKLLDSLCKSKSLNNIQVDSFFDNAGEELFVCKELEKKNLLKATWLDGGRIAGITSREITCNAVETNSLMKEFMHRDRQENKEQLETDVLKLQKENLEKSSKIIIDVFEIKNHKPILTYKISVVDKFIILVSNKDVPQTGSRFVIDNQVREKFVIDDLNDNEKFDFGSQLTHKFKIKSFGKNYLFLNLTDIDLINLGFKENTSIIVPTITPVKHKPTNFIEKPTKNKKWSKGEIIGLIGIILGVPGFIIALPSLKTIYDQLIENKLNKEQKLHPIENKQSEQSYFVKDSINAEKSDTLHGK